MNPGFILLGSHLGDPERKILTPAQIRVLTERMGRAGLQDSSRELTLSDLRALGYGGEMGERILRLLSQQQLLRDYLRRAGACFPLLRSEEDYPVLVRRRLGGESPCCFFGKGNRSLLNTPAVALVGSRELLPANAEFARVAGQQAAEHGLTLVSGNARGADRTAQQACLQAGGNVISIVADGLEDKHPGSRMLYLSQEDYDAEFSSQRALSRNRIIHSMGCMTLVAQCSLGSGGTWSGTAANLQHGWSPVVCFRDGSDGTLELQKRGAFLADMDFLAGLDLPQPLQVAFPGF